MKEIEFGVEEKGFWSRLFHKKSDDDYNINFLRITGSLLSSSTSNENIAKAKELAELHRLVENTKARRRLEKWSLNVIGLYLLAVLLIVFLNYTEIRYLNGVIKIPESIMVAILTTTTVNIIGLGLIVLRGHFLANGENGRRKR